MESKAWYKSKAVWTGIAGVVLAAYATASTHFGLPPIPEWVFGVLASLGIYSRVTANTTIK